VTPSTGSTVPTGSVIFTIGSATQTVALNASGVATYTGTAPTASGSLSMSAAYQGSTEFAASTSSTLSETITAIRARRARHLSERDFARGRIELHADGDSDTIVPAALHPPAA